MKTLNLFLLSVLESLEIRVAGDPLCSGLGLGLLPSNLAHQPKEERHAADFDS
jgi:hypothetical protein